jgi:hypothetical protein
MEFFVGQILQFSKDKTVNVLEVLEKSLVVDLDGRVMRFSKSRFGG